MVQHMLQGWEACWIRARDRAAASGGKGGRVAAMAVLAVGPAMATAGWREQRQAETDVALKATTEAAATAAVAEVTVPRRATREATEETAETAARVRVVEAITAKAMAEG